VAAAAADGTWERAKACRADDCRWAFYDQSRNRSARWCDMAVCGNRTKVRAYRAKRGDGP
jgi:predicted RNA-binding Zn ribbon-like protein